MNFVLINIPEQTFATNSINKHVAKEFNIDSSFVYV